MSAILTFLQLMRMHFLNIYFFQTLREPAIFAKGLVDDSEGPHDKVTLAQARRGTPGKSFICTFK